MGYFWKEIITFDNIGYVYYNKVILLAEYDFIIFKKGVMTYGKKCY